MRPCSAARCVRVIVLSLVTMVVACTQDTKPAFLKSLTEGKEVKEEGPASEGGSNIRVKEITKVSHVASVVLDKNCPDIVQPYKLTDNLVSLGWFTAKEEVGVVWRKLSVDKSSRPAKEENIPPSTKLAAKQLNWLPMSAEVLYGERLHAEETNILDRDHRLGKTHYPTADRMREEILSKIGEPHDYEFKVFILKNPTRNAVARPGGFLYLDQGLIDDPAGHPKAYFALAHEVAHVLQRHETQELQSRIVDSISSRDELVKTVVGVKKDPSIIFAHVKAKKNLFTRHHMDQELQADSCAAKLLSRVFPDSRSLANSLNAFLKDLPAPERTQPQPPPKSEADKLAATVHDIVDTPISRHPSSEERYRNLKAIYNEIMKENVSKRR